MTVVEVEFHRPARAIVMGIEAKRLTNSVILDRPHCSLSLIRTSSAAVSAGDARSPRTLPVPLADAGSWLVGACRTMTLWEETSRITWSTGY